MDVFLNAGSASIQLLIFYWFLGVFVNKEDLNRFAFMDIIIAIFSIFLYLGNHDLGAGVSLYMGYLARIRSVKEIKEIIKGKIKDGIKQ